MKWRTGIAIVAAASASAGSASAQSAREERELVPRQRAPLQATELSVDLGYTQGFGGIGTPPGRVSGIAGAGLGAGVGIGYRATPHSSVSLSGQFQEFNAATGNGKARGAALGVEGAYHIRPFRGLDPWVAGGAGYRMLWDLPGGSGNARLLHGVELAKFKVGLDLRATKDIAIGPLIGADLNMFLFNNPAGPGGNAMITPKVSTFVYGGVQGRFNFGGRRVLEMPTTAVGQWSLGK